MVHIYWDENSEGYRPEMRYFFASELAYEFHLELQIGLTLYHGIRHPENRGKPYVEVDAYGNRVAIRQITHLPEKERDALVKKSNEIYKDIFLKPRGKK